MKSIVFVISLCISFKVQAQWPTSIREIPAPFLNDVACASYDQMGPVIYYNPQQCQLFGQLVTSFFMAHEYGHHNLGHVINQRNPNQYVQLWLTFNAENEADYYAVNYWVSQGNKAVIQATYNAMIQINNAGDMTHPPSRVRAANIANAYFQLTGTSLF